MKKLLIFIIFALLIPSALAIYGGESITLYDGDCKSMLLNVTVKPFQSEGEYDLTSCDYTGGNNITKSYVCDCNNSINLTPAANSVGDYHFTMKNLSFSCDGSAFYASVNRTIVIQFPETNITRHVPKGSFFCAHEGEDYIAPETGVMISDVQEPLSFNANGCYDIYTKKGEPLRVEANGKSVEYTYNNSIISVCAQGNIQVIWQDDETGSGGSGSTASETDNTPDRRPGGSSGITDTECVPRWGCSDWSACNNGEQTRECIDLSGCGEDPPRQTRTCEVAGTQSTVSFESDTTETNNTVNLEFNETKDSGSQVTGAFLGGGYTNYYMLALFAVLILAAIIVVYKKKKS